MKLFYISRANEALEFPQWPYGTSESGPEALNHINHICSRGVLYPAIIIRWHTTWMKLWNSFTWRTSTPDAGINYVLMLFLLQHLTDACSGCREVKQVSVCWQCREVGWEHCKHAGTGASLVAYRGIPYVSHAAVSFGSLFWLCNWKFTEHWRTLPSV